ncbi:uncharacterized protein [Physcomitrium patens]|uniref:Uncharacterized protein n=1 Tax=Physcomitrium patens TaxID=3218 RepID=A0A2K1JBS5_PHYPA|nr:uncharacterized protein LOC112292806 [Physcomitrium patens]PNR38961.1 hypothetical protein PHYPA_019239 [Physcomitrium patens]|eukprot:XP_024397404.1 uncharacterized protein LOC112292806 [Physcomitrella patens]
MRSHIISNEAPLRPQEKGDVYVSHGTGQIDAGWPVVHHGQQSSWLSGFRCGVSVEGHCDVENKALNSLEEHRSEEHLSAQDEDSNFDVLAQRVDELIARQSQFAFLKPCRQLEKHYANKRNSGSCSFRHGDRTIPATEAAFKHKKMHENLKDSSSQGKEYHQESSSRKACRASVLQESEREVEKIQTAQCRFLDSDVKPKSTIRELLSTPSNPKNVEQGPLQTPPHDHVDGRKHHDLAASVPCKWDEQLDKPKSIAAAAQRALARKLSRDGIELNCFVEDKSPISSSQRTSAREGEVSTNDHPHKVAHSSSHRVTASERFHGRAGHVQRNSGDSRIWRISSTRCSIYEKEAHIDLVAPSAAKFLIETSESSLYTSANHHNASPPSVAVPFKWEDTPGKAKVDETAGKSKPETLQLPPRLAVHMHRTTKSNFARELRVSVASHSLGGLFPCMTATSSPSRLQQQDPTWMHQYRATKSSLPKQSQAHHGYAYAGNQESVSSKSSDRSVNPRKINKPLSQPLTSTDSPLNLKPRKLLSSELKASHPWMHRSGSSHSCSDPTSILHSGRQSSSSRTYLSCDFGASTPSMAGSKSSSSASYESIEEDFAPDHDHDNTVSPSYITKSHSFDSQTSMGYSESPIVPNFGPSAKVTFQGKRSNAHRSECVKSLLKLCKSHGKCLRKSKSNRKRLGSLYSPEVWAPTLATYFQRLDVTEAAISNGLLDKQGAPTSSGYLNSNGEPIPLQDCTFDTYDTSPEASPKRPTRLPYRMPSVEEQELATRHTRNLVGKLEANSRGRDYSNSRMYMNIVSPTQLDKCWTSSHREEYCPPPAYAATLEMLSPTVNLVSRRHKSSRALPLSSWSSPKPHRRVQFILSICKTLKRVLFRQPARRSVIGTKLMYHEKRVPTTFQFSNPN